MHPAELGELEAFRDLFAAAAPGIGARAAEIGGVVCLKVEALPAIEVNRVLGLGLTHPADEETLAAIEGYFGGPPPCVAVTPEAQPPELTTWLEEGGLQPGYAWTKFIRAAARVPPKPTALRVERVTEGAPFGSAFVSGYGLPQALAPWFAAVAHRHGWQCFVAFDGDQPAGAGALYVSGEVGWLGMAATVPAHRGKGAQGAILAARIGAAAAAGCSVVVTETGSPVEGKPGPSFRNILRAGFEPAYERENWVPAD
jgi:GNAT superfamily N-acetyltransferase